MSGARGRPSDDLPGADDDGGQAGAGDRDVEHLAAQEEGAGGGVGDDHRDRQLDPLPAVRRAGVGEAQPIGVLRRPAKNRVLGAEQQCRIVVV